MVGAGEADSGYAVEPAAVPASPSRGLQWKYGAGVASSGGGGSGGGYQAQHSAAQQLKLQQQQQQQQQQHYHPAAGSAAALASAAAFAAGDLPSSPYAASRVTSRIGAGTAAFAPATPSAAGGALPASDCRARVACTPSGYPADGLVAPQLQALCAPQSRVYASPAGSAGGYETGDGHAPSQGAGSAGGARCATAPLQWSLPQGCASPMRGASPMRQRDSHGSPGARATSAAVGLSTDTAATPPRGGQAHSASHFRQQQRGLDWGVTPVQRGSSARSGDGSGGGGGTGLWGSSGGGDAPPIAAGPRPPSQQRLEGLGRLKQLSTQRLATRIGTPPSADAAAAMLSEGGLGLGTGADAGAAEAARPAWGSAPGRAQAAGAAGRRSSGAPGLGAAQHTPVRAERTAVGNGRLSDSMAASRAAEGPRRSDPAAAHPQHQQQQQQQRQERPSPPPRPQAREPEPALGPGAYPAGPEEEEDRAECSTCGRRFAAAALERHARVCAKVFCSKRPAFDSAGRRAVEGGMAAPPLAPAPQRRAARAAPGQACRGGAAEVGGKAKWAKQSDQLRAAMRAARGGGGGSGADAGGGMAFAEPEEDDRCGFWGGDRRDLFVT